MKYMISICEIEEIGVLLFIFAQFRFIASYLNG